MRRLSHPAVRALLVLCAFFSLGAKHENWVEVRSPNFIVVSNAGEKQARKTALQFEQIREVFRKSLAVASNHPSPVITILAVKDEGSMRELLPEYWAKGHTHLGGIFIFRMNIYFAAVELDEEAEGAFETFYHEYYHSVTMPYFPKLPVWLAEGLAEFYGHTKIDEKSVGMGQPDALLLAELKNEPFIPLNVLFQVDQSSRYYNEANKTSIFYAESWALTHYLMMGDRGAHRPLLLAYLKALDQGKPSEQAAAEAFGDLRKLQSELINYLNKPSFFYLKVPAVSKVADVDLKARAISEAEADAYKGGFATIRGRFQDADSTLEQAIKIDPNCALAYEYVGLNQFFEGKRDEAIDSLSKSISLDSKNSFTRFLRAQLSLASGMAESSRSEDDLRQAIALSPDFASPYALLAVYMAGQHENLPEALTFAEKAVSFEPGNSGYQLALAQVLARMEKYDAAKTAALKAASSARQPQERANAQSFLSYLGEAKNYQANRPPLNAGEPGNVIDEGTVASVTCEGGSKVDTIDLDTAGAILHLRLSPNLSPAFTSEGKLPEGFNPCTSLKGLSVSVQYRLDQHDANSGQIRSLRVLAAEDPAAKLPPGSAMAEGKVADVTCRDNDMQLRLALDGDKFLVLHASDYTKINYLAGTTSSMGDMEPCTQMKGRSVRITYAETQQKKFAGEMQTIIVGK